MKFEDIFGDPSSSNPGLRKGWDKGVGNPHGSDDTDDTGGDEPKAR